MKDHIEHIDLAEKLDKAVPAMTLTGSGGAVLGGLTYNELLATAGFIIALTSLAFDVWFKLKKLKLMKQENEAND